jgi:hypothetical protein
MKSLIHTIKGIDPVADAFAGTVYSDVVSMRNYKTAIFTIYRGVSTGGTGTSTVTVQACSDTTPSARSAVAFRYQVCTTGDTWGEIIECANTGFAITVGSSQLYRVFVDASVLGELGYEFVQLKLVEAVDDPSVGCVLIELVEGKDEKEVPETAIA